MSEVNSLLGASSLWPGTPRFELVDVTYCALCFTSLGPSRVHFLVLFHFLAEYGNLRASTEHWQRAKVRLPIDLSIQVKPLLLHPPL